MKIQSFSWTTVPKLFWLNNRKYFNYARKGQWVRRKLDLASCSLVTSHHASRARFLTPWECWLNQKPQTSVRSTLLSGSKQQRFSGTRNWQRICDVDSEQLQGNSCRRKRGCYRIAILRANNSMTIQMRFFAICLEYYRLLISEIKFRVFWLVTTTLSKTS